MSEAVVISKSQINEAVVVYKSMQDVLRYLYERWNDERGHENFADYQALVASKLPKNVKFVTMTSRPFAVVFELNGHKFQLLVRSRDYALNVIL